MQKPFGSEWKDTVTVVLPNRSAWLTPQRIHPDDEHLQYGPISTALRDAAADADKWDFTGDFGRMAMAYACWHDLNWAWGPDSGRSLFLLILAEALADEGM